MKLSREQVLADTVEFIPTAREDFESWEGAPEISEHTSLISDLDFGSLELVILANAAQERYGQVFRFIDWFQELGRQERQDITVGEWVDFVHAGLSDETSTARAPQANR
jgi:hypothetical protein